MLHLQHRNQQFLGKWPSTAMWLDTNFGGLTRQWWINDRPSPFFWILRSLILQISIAKYVYTLIAMLTICVLLSTLITKTHRFIIVKNIKNPPNLRILQCCDHAHSSEYSGSVTVWGFILFRYYYRFYIAANPSSLGVFLHICIIYRYFYK